MVFRVQPSSDSGLKSDNHLHMYFSAFICTWNKTHHGSFSSAHPPDFLVYENNFIISLPVSQVSLLFAGYHGTIQSNSIWQMVLSDSCMPNMELGLWPLQVPNLVKVKVESAMVLLCYSDFPQGWIDQKHEFWVRVVATKVDEGQIKQTFGRKHLWHPVDNPT